MDPQHLFRLCCGSAYGHLEMEDETHSYIPGTQFQGDPVTHDLIIWAAEFPLTALCCLLQRPSWY